MDEKKLHNVQLTDEELEAIHGGYYVWKDRNSDDYYVWKGLAKDEGMRYLCPKCGRPVHPGAAGRYYCDPCNESWFVERYLDPNLASGLWKRTLDPERESIPSLEPFSRQ